MIPMEIELRTIRERQAERWREADAFRLGRAMRAGQPPWRDRAYRTMGGWLIAWGARLQRLASDIEAPSRSAAVVHGPSL